MMSAKEIYHTLLRACPQDISLLNEAREKLEGLIDEICEAQAVPKPRMYPQ